MNVEPDELYRFVHEPFSLSEERIEAILTELQNDEKLYAAYEKLMKKAGFEIPTDKSLEDPETN